MWCFRKGFVSCTKKELKELIEKELNSDSFLFDDLESDKFGLAKFHP